MAEWEVNKLYVIGHQRPDTDAIAAAIGYAWYLRSTDRPEAVAARCGHPTEQTRFALRRFGVETPALVSSVAATFGHAARALTPVDRNQPVATVLPRLGAGERVVPIVDEAGGPLGLITPRVLAAALGDTSGFAIALSRACGEAAEPAAVYVDVERVRDHRFGLLRTSADDFMVADSSGKYRGVISRADVLDPPRARLVLVDHNELAQAVPGAEEAEIVAVLDHHRLGNAHTPTPIPFVIDPVGSTSTLVSERIRAAGLDCAVGLAGMLLSGILSDTLVFRSPTATCRDEAAAAWLAELAGVDVTTYGRELLMAAPGLVGRGGREILDADRKAYTMGGFNVSISQVEVGGFQDLNEARDDLLVAMDETMRSEALDLVCLMVTDVVRGSSLLLARGVRAALAAIPYPLRHENEWELGDVLSRKKELVPTLEDAFQPA